MNVTSWPPIDRNDLQWIHLASETGSILSFCLRDLHSDMNSPTSYAWLTLRVDRITGDLGNI